MFGASNIVIFLPSSLAFCSTTAKSSTREANLFNTASVEGQTSFKKKITIDNFNKNISQEEKYLYPGEVE